MNMADMFIHVHPELDAETRTNLERSISGHVGVDCAEFVRQPHPHTLIVKYDGDAIQGTQILDMVRKLDPEATRVSL
jgi:hypothetical protein